MPSKEKQSRRPPSVPSACVYDTTLAVNVMTFEIHIYRLNWINIPVQIGTYEYRFVFLRLSAVCSTECVRSRNSALEATVNLDTSAERVLHDIIAFVCTRARVRTHTICSRIGKFAGRARLLLYAGMRSGP